MKKIFCPVLKTKRVSEKNALIALKPLLETNKDVIPYLELLKDEDIDRTNKYVDVLDKIPFFIEPVSSNKASGLLSYPLAIPVFSVNKSTNTADLYSFIACCHQDDRSAAVKINCYNSKDAIDLLNRLNEKDYLFIDIDRNEYSSVSLLKIIRIIPRKCKIIINSNERNVAYSGRDFSKYNDSFPKDVLFNTTLIQAIKDGSFAFDGFGSYCAAKNDLTEEIQIANTVYGYLLVYNYEQNNFYIVTTNGSDHITRIYKTLVEEIYSGSKTVLSYLSTTPRSKDMLEEAHLLKKLSCPKKITIEITHYIEEIINNLK